MGGRPPLEAQVRTRRRFGWAPANLETQVRTRRRFGWAPANPALIALGREIGKRLKDAEVT